MNNIVVHKGIKFALNMDNPPCEIKDLGWAHNATLIGSYTRDQLTDLMSLTLWGSKVLAVESFAVETQTDRRIALLLESKKW